MKKILIIFTLTFGFAVAHATSETVKGAKKDYENFKKEMSVKLDETQKKIDELKAQGKDKADAAHKETLKELEQTQAKLKIEFEKFKDDSKKQTTKLKNDLAASISALNAKIQKALKE